MKILLSIFIFSLIILITGCAKIKEFGNDAPPNRTVAISLFRCNCEPSTQEIIQETFIDIFFRNTNARPIKGEKGDILIKGTISMGDGESLLAKGSNFGSTSASVGSYVSGISIQVYNSTGDMIATHSIGQDLGRGVLLSPVALASRSATFISTVLVRQNEIGRK